VVRMSIYRTIRGFAAHKLLTEQTKRSNFLSAILFRRKYKLCSAAINAAIIFPRIGFTVTPVHCNQGNDLGGGVASECGEDVAERTAELFRREIEIGGYGDEPIRSDLRKLLQYCYACMWTRRTRSRAYSRRRSSHAHVREGLGTRTRLAS